MAQTATLTIESPAFEDGGVIPTKYTGDGPDHSPELRWSEPPEGTRELALIVDDPHAPTREPWTHWLIYKIPPDVRGLPEAVPKGKLHLDDPKGAVQGKNSFGSIGYGGPAPPKGHGRHHYHFKLYALDTPLDIGAGADRTTVLRAMADRVLAKGELIGTYERP